MPGVPVRLSERAIVVLQRALAAARMDPSAVAIRLTLGPAGDLRTSFADEPEPGDSTITAEGLRVFLPASLAAADISIDVSSEHDRIVLGPPAADAT